MFEATYVSNADIERTEAYRRGYRNVCERPREIGVLEPSELLVIDANQFHGDDQKLAVAKANAAAQRGGLVGIHTYDPDAPALQTLVKLPHVIVAPDHRRLLYELVEHAKLHGRPWEHIAAAANALDDDGQSPPDNEGTKDYVAIALEGVQGAD